LIKKAIKKVKNGQGSYCELKDTFKNLEGKCFKICKKGSKCSQDREVLEDIKKLANKILDRIDKKIEVLIVQEVRVINKS
jgi:hypothetical protein